MRLRDPGSLSVVCGMPSVSSALRVKPALARGKRTRRSAVPVLRGGQTSRYVVDSVLGETASQQHTYQALVAPLVDSFVQVCLYYCDAIGGCAGCERRHQPISSSMQLRLMPCVPVQHSTSNMTSKCKHLSLVSMAEACDIFYTVVAA